MEWKGKTCLLILLALGLLFCGPAAADKKGLVWSTFLGGGGSDESFAIATDGSGNVYVTGFTWSIDFPTTVGAFDEAHNSPGYYDAFVAKLNPEGSALVYATFLGGSGTDQGYGIAVDGLGNACVTGRTDSEDFPTTEGAFRESSAGGAYDAFVAKLNPAGSALVYATFLGGSDYDRGKSIATDVSGNAYLTGWTKSADFPTTEGAFSTIHLSPGEEDAFVAKLNPAGSALVYATFLGGSSEDWGKSIATDVSGNAYVGGLTYSADFPTTARAFDTTYNGNRDAMVIKLNPAGSALVYATFLGGDGQDWIEDIATDGAGNAYLTGATLSADFPTTVGAFDSVHHGFSDVFVAQLNAVGSDLVYATFLGGRGEERATGIATDGAGNAYVTGFTRSTDFPTAAVAFDTSHNGQSDAFVVKFNPSGSTLVYATFLGGDSLDISHGIAAAGAGNAYLSGWTTSGDFPTTTGSFDATYNGSYDIFVSKFDLRSYPGR